MPIYTKTGDDGTTSLIGGKRVLKCDPQVEAYGSIDELSAFMGLIIGKIRNEKERSFLTLIQKDLHQIMACLAGEELKTLTLGLETRIGEMEKIMDKLDKKLPKINKFILTQGGESSCWLQILRTVCRRTERRIVDFKNEKIIIKYLNRLSDFFFILGRFYNKKEILV